MTTPTLSAEPVCPGAVDGSKRTATASTPNPERRFVAERRPFDSIPQATWDRLLAANPWSTPFSSWAFQRAWWDAYGANAHDETVVVVPAGGAGGPVAGADPIGIVPLMHRHEVEPSDLAGQTRMRHSAEIEMTPVPGSATAIFFGASYHADYATLLAAPGDLDVVAEAVAATWGGPRDPPGTSSTCAGCAAATRPPRPWPPPSAGARRRAGWTLNLEREDVCPVVTLPEGGGLRGLPGQPGQEGAPRDPPEAAPGRGGRPDHADPFDRPAGRPAGVHRAPPEALGRRGPLPRDRRRGDEPGLLPAPVRAARSRRPAGPVVPGGRRAASRSGRPPGRRRIAALLQRGHGSRRARVSAPAC